MGEVGLEHFHLVTEAAASLAVSRLRKMADLVLEARNRHGRVYICGNGGSMSNAQHWACDLMKAASVPAVALGSNPALVTAYGNDLGFETIFVPELVGGTPHDVLICLSVSGTSPNIRRTLLGAHQLHLPRVLISGAQCPDYEDDELLHIRVASTDYAVVEDVHAQIGHWLTKRLQEVQQT